MAEANDALSRDWFRPHVMADISREERIKERRSQLALMFGVAAAAVVLIAYGRLDQTFKFVWGAFVIGMFWQLRELTRDWIKLGKIALGALVIALLTVFFPAHQDCSFQSWFGALPAIFAGGMLLSSIFVCREQLSAPLGEGVSLLHTLSILYWLAAVSAPHTWLYLCALPALFVFILSFADFPLTNVDCVCLSVWSSIVMAVFAFNFCMSVAQLAMTTNAQELWSNGGRHGAYLFLQFFLLGASGPYILWNFILVAGYFPGRDTFEWRQRIKDINEAHLQRYSKTKLPKALLAATAATVAVIYGINYRMNVLDPSLAVWIVLLAVPLIAQIAQRTPEPDPNII